MLKINLLIFLFSFTFCIAQEPTIEALRESLKKAAKDEIECKKIIKNLHSYTEKNNALYAGYKACATMMMAKYLINPYNKLSYFLEGKKLLEKCIQKENKNLELRVLRLSVQVKAPSFLGYSSNIKTDKEYILNALTKIKDLHTKRELKTILLNTNCLTNSEKQLL